MKTDPFHISNFTWNTPHTYPAEEEKLTINKNRLSQNNIKNSIYFLPHWSLEAFRILLLHSQPNRLSRLSPGFDRSKFLNLISSFSQVNLCKHPHDDKNKLLHLPFRYSQNTRSIYPHSSYDKFQNHAYNKGTTRWETNCCKF